MRALIDFDVLRYECGAQGQYVDDDGEIVMKSFDTVAGIVDQKIKEICALVWATEEPLLFLSMDIRTKKRDARKIEKKVKRLEQQCPQERMTATEVAELQDMKEQQVYKPNFREAVAKKKVYKGNRAASVKPLHYDNITEYVLATYECVMAEGLEADDLLSVYQMNALRESHTPTTIICSRDKDLKITQGMHFSWECGKQRQFGPELVSELGRLLPIYRGKNAKGEPKLAELKGTGMLFFCTQLITGDTVDNIPGLPGKGPAAAFAALKGIATVDEALLAVKELYVNKFGNDWEAELLEQGQLLWMVNELTEDGKPIMWSVPECLKDGWGELTLDILDYVGEAWEIPKCLS